MVELITRDIPFICTVSAKDLNAADRIMLEKVHKVSVDNFILVDHKKDCIFINKDLDNVSEIKELIIKIMHSKYLPEKLLDRFQELTNEDADRILIRIFCDWREEKRKKSLHDSALAELKKSKSLRIHWTPESLSKKGHGTSQFFGFFLHPGTGLRHKIELSVRLKFRRWLAYVYHVKI